MLRKKSVVLLASLLFLLLAVSFVSADGCLLYPEDEALYCVDADLFRAECEASGDCPDYEVGESCSVLSECSEIVTCTVDCEEHTAGYCSEVLGGEAVSDFAAQCSPGCCSFSTGLGTQCRYSENAYACSQVAESFGRSSYDFDTSLGRDACLAVCGDVPVDPDPVEGESAELNVLVRDTSGALEGAAVFVSGTRSATAVTNSAGEIELTLPLGSYELSVSKAGYTPYIEDFVLELGGYSTEVVLEVGERQGVRGTVYLVDEGEEVGEIAHGARLYIDGVFKGWTGSDGMFDLSVGEVGTHILRGTYGDGYQGQAEFSVTAGETTVLARLELTRYVGVCDTEALAVPELRAAHVLGEPSVSLTWDKPCPEVIGYNLYRDDVLLETLSATQLFYTDTDLVWRESYSYAIEAVYNPALDADAGIRLSDLTTANPSPITLGQEECANRNFGASFCLAEGSEEFSPSPHLIYTCSAENLVIETGRDCQASLDSATAYCAPVNENEAVCKDEGACLVGDGPFGLFKSEDACYGATNVDGAADTDYYCSYDSQTAVSSGTVVNSCVGCSTVTSCFDYKTAGACGVNNCLSTACSWVESGSNEDPEIDYTELIDYDLLGGVYPQETFEETGAGYCAPVEYSGEDACSLCGPEAGVFGNYLCSADVCSSLGRCFSQAEHLPGGALAACSTCGEEPSAGASCYSYVSEQECSGGQNFAITDGLVHSYSQDSCSWGRCSWSSSASAGSNACVKDGDGDGSDDCSGFTGGDLASCQLDVLSPTTQIVGADLPLLSLDSPNVTFQAVDERTVPYELFYCLRDVGSGSCSSIEEFSSAMYPQIRTDEEVRVDLLADLGERVDGKTFSVRYFSDDRFHNREAVREDFVFIDNVAPEFELIYENVTAGDRTDLNVFVNGLEERASCDFVLEPIFPPGETRTSRVGFESEAKEARFTDLPGVRYDLNVTCVDELGNDFSRALSLVFDLEQRIEITSPQEVVSDPLVTFSANTVTQAVCELHVFTGSSFVFVDDFTTDESGRTHSLEHDVSSRYARDYHQIADYQILCHDLLTREQYSKPFNFALDMTPGTAQISLVEGSREYIPEGNNWEASFFSEVHAEFSCLRDDAGLQHDCDEFYYCQAALGETCFDAPLETYNLVDERLSFTESTSLCYYGVDGGANTPYRVICGELLIDGFGITLVSPEPYWYNSEIFGVSDEPVFDWRFLTRVPTAQCRWSFSSGFSFDDAPGFRHLVSTDGHNYLYPDFPQGTASSFRASGSSKPIYVQCIDGDGTVGPEQKFTLEYDPSAPEIERAYAQPRRVVESASTGFFVETDDKTWCAYEDDEGSVHTFPGKEDNVLKRTHEQTHFISFTGLTREYSFPVWCSNGAGLVSERDSLDFSVDYTELGNIVSLSPDGDFFFDGARIPLSASTSKNGVCSVLVSGELVEMAGAGGRDHSYALTNISEGSHEVPLQCVLEGNYVESAFRFTIDSSPPSIYRVDDGRASCGSDSLSLFVYTNDSSVASYDYELYEVGSFNSTGGSLVLSGSSDTAQPIRVDATNLSNDSIYVFSVRARDGAGNVGEYVRSDGVRITSEDSAICEDDREGPFVSVIVDDLSSCTETDIELVCEDATGCSELFYGTSNTADGCVADLAYTGSRISVNGEKIICYEASDTLGRNVSSQRTIAFLDQDGDGVRDSCDSCPDSRAGRVVDDLGCAIGQVSVAEPVLDSDDDGLPDAWELQYNSLDCPVDPHNSDTDGDGERDTQEDYDGDGQSTYTEYLRGTHPCVEDRVLEGEFDTNDDFAFDDTGVRDGDQKKGDPIAWLFFILGLLLDGAGIGYLVYYYKKTGLLGGSGRTKPGARSSQVTAGAPAASIKGPGTQRSLWPKRDQRRAGRVKKQRRASLFDSFNSSSASIPHVDEALSKRAPKLEKLQDLAVKIDPHTPKLTPGLREHEKDVFGRLSDIAKKTKTKPIEKVVSKDEADSIFKKLRKISKERKK